jgi:quercetin dioxygenase-like cupin family protein
LTYPSEPDAPYCVMLGTIPAGVSVPLHSHRAAESFYLLSGIVQVLCDQGGDFKWLDLKKGDFFHIPSNIKHAWRNPSSEPVNCLITTTPEIGRFFLDVGQPVVAGAQPRQPTPEELDRFAQVAVQYEHWLGSPAENAAVGIFI